MANIARRGPLGSGAYQQLSPTAATGLTIPTGTGTPIGSADKYRDENVALIVAETQDVRWRDDGTDPTAAVGMLLPKNVPFWYYGDLNRIKFIEVTSAAKVNVTIYSAPTGFSQ